jgi:hypothetical protein
MALPFNHWFITREYDFKVSLSTTIAGQVIHRSCKCGITTGKHTISQLLPRCFTHVVVVTPPASQGLIPSIRSIRQQGHIATGLVITHDSLT